MQQQLKSSKPVAPSAPAPLRPVPTRSEPESCIPCGQNPRLQAISGQKGDSLSAKPFPCGECKQEFGTKRELDLHMKYIHRSKED
mmetsp:Transcript_70333/g.198479  ORF Transcript_70333/g.198479 Transcript_70333/m.198479 type:complete len:85 (-) Transcript_70333:140-394(-)